MLLCDTLTTGGAETFVLRLAHALRERGHDVLLAILRGDRIERALVDSIAPGVSIASLQLFGLPVLLRLDGIFQTLGMGFSLLRWVQQRWLARLISRYRPGVVHSHLITCDLVAAHACNEAGKRWLSTMHGDYLAMELSGSNRAARVQNFGQAIANIEVGIDAIVCITDDQQNQVRRLMPQLATRDGIHKIYNGYPRSREEATLLLPHLLREIPEDHLVIGMVARGIREKGWDVMLEGFRLANLPNAWLVLVGDGPRIAELRQLIDDSRVLFAGSVTDPLNYIRRFDIACLPSLFTTESLPTVIIEYLQQGKPVLATHVGEIPAMLRIDTPDVAGVTIPLESEAAMTKSMSASLRALGKDEALRSRLAQASLRAFEPFNMDACVHQYECLYRELMHDP